MNENPGAWDLEIRGQLRVASLNIARLAPHMDDLRIDPTLLKADLLHLSETWVQPALEDAAVYQLEGFQAHFVSVGNGRGIATFSRRGFQHQEDRKEQDFQISKFTSPTLDSIYIYRFAICCNLLQAIQISHKISNHEILITGQRQEANKRW